MNRLVALGMVLFAACSTPVEICGCPPKDPLATVVLEGAVLDSESTPISGAEVSPLGVLRVDCGWDANDLFAYPNPAVSNSDGGFTMLLITPRLAGMHCFDLVARVPSSGVTDTIRDVQADFRPEGPFPDTVTVQIVVAS